MEARLTIELVGAEPLFASPLFTFAVPGADQLNLRLAEAARRRRRETEGLQRSNIGGWRSPSDFFEAADAASRELQQRLVEIVGHATRTVAPEFDFRTTALDLEGWCNILDEGSYNAPHDHPGYAWSGVYYVEVGDAGAEDDRAGIIEFLDTRAGARAVTIQGAPCFFTKQAVRPWAGMALLFPAYLRHWVHPSRAAERISIAFNARFVPRPPGPARGPVGDRLSLGRSGPMQPGRDGAGPQGTGASGRPPHRSSCCPKSP